jgi:hypothetical protein
MDGARWAADPVLTVARGRHHLGAVAHKPSDQLGLVQEPARGHCAVDENYVALTEGEGRRQLAFTATTVHSSLEGSRNQLRVDVAPEAQHRL